MTGLLSARELAAALNGRPIGRGQWMAKCVAHREKTGSLSIREGVAGPLLFCHGGCTQVEVIDALRGLSLWPDRDHSELRPRPPPRRVSDTPPPPDSANELHRVREILRQSIEPTPELSVGLYLIGREIPPPWPACIRQHPRLFHKPSNSYWPAMTAAIRDLYTDRICGVQRTYLAIDGSGKAPVEPQKMILGRARNAAVKLSADEDVVGGLGVCEGIETGLSILTTEWRPLWALLSSSNIAKLPVLAIEALTIFGDHDPNGAGEAGAHECRGRWKASGKEVTLYVPKAVDVDWNDELGHR